MMKTKVAPFYLGHGVVCVLSLISAFCVALLRRNMPNK